MAKKFDHFAAIHTLLEAEALLRLMLQSVERGENKLTAFEVSTVLETVLPKICAARDWIDENADRVLVPVETAA